MFRVVAKSWGGTKWTVTEDLTEAEAVDFCDSYGWTLCPDGGYIWDLEIEEQ